MFSSPASCLKFDGFAPDGERVWMRDCGFFSVNECDDNYVLNKALGVGVATGRLCHCTKGMCNAAGSNAAAAAVVFVGVVLTCRVM